VLEPRRVPRVSSDKCKGTVYRHYWQHWITVRMYCIFRFSGIFQGCSAKSACTPAYARVMIGHDASARDLATLLASALSFLFPFPMPSLLRTVTRRDRRTFFFLNSSTISSFMYKTYDYRIHLHSRASRVPRCQ